MTPEIFAAVDRYVSDLLAPEDDVLKATVASIDEAGMPQISVSANQGRLLEMFVRLTGAKRVLELGTLAGYSTIWMARALPFDGALISLEYDPKHAEVARKNIERAGLSQQVDIRTGKALELLPLLELEGAGPFDMIFIDADKPPYLEYFQWALKLSRPGTLIIADNVVRNGAILDPGNTDERVAGVRRLNEFLGSCEAVTATILQTVGAKEHDGMAIAIVK